MVQTKIFRVLGFPRGEAKGQLQELVPFNVLLCSVRKWRLRRTGSPTW